MPTSKLTEKQKAFADYLLTDPEQNQTKAYLHAYPKSTQRASEAGGSKLVRNPKVADYLNRARAKRSAKTEINAQYVLNRLAEIDQMDVIDILNDDLSMKPLSQWPKSWRTTLSGLDISEIGVGQDVTAIIKKIKWPDKVKNLELLGKHVDVRAFDKDSEKEPVADLASALSELAKRLPGA